MIVPAGHPAVQGEALRAEADGDAEVGVLAAGLEVLADGHLEVRDLCEAHLGHEVGSSAAHGVPLQRDRDVRAHAVVPPDRRRHWERCRQTASLRVEHGSVAPRLTHAVGSDEPAGWELEGAQQRDAAPTRRAHRGALYAELVLQEDPPHVVTPCGLCEESMGCRRAGEGRQTRCDPDGLHDGCKHVVAYIYEHDALDLVTPRHVKAPFRRCQDGASTSSLFEPTQPQRLRLRRQPPKRAPRHTACFRRSQGRNEAGYFCPASVRVTSQRGRGRGLMGVRANAHQRRST